MILKSTIAFTSTSWIYLRETAGEPLVKVIYVDSQFETTSAEVGGLY